MGASRRGEHEPGKSDQIDARAIARAVLRESAVRPVKQWLILSPTGDTALRNRDVDSRELRISPDMGATRRGDRSG